MKKTLKNLALAGALGLASLMPIKTEAQSDSVKASKVTFSPSLELVKSESDKASFLRPSFYLKNGDLFDVYAFGEFYKGKRSGYFGKAVLKTELKAPIQPTAEIVYFGNHFNDLKAMAGFGASYNVPVPKGFLNLKALGLWSDISGRFMGEINHKLMMGYTAGIDLPLGMSLFSFGETNVDAKYTKDSRWGYGEVQLSKKLSDNLSIAYNPLLKNQDKARPRWENAFSANIKF